MTLILLNVFNNTSVLNFINKMRYCVYCDRNDVTSRDVSFHSFPKDDDIVIVWLTNMGVNIKWRPLKSHFLCSKHFASDCMIGNRLRKGSIPSIFEKNDKVNDKEIEMNCQEIKVKKVYSREYNVNKKNIKKKIVEEPKMNGESNTNREINESNQMLEVKKEVDIDDEFKMNVECSIKRETDEEDEIKKIKKEPINVVEEEIQISIKEENISDDELIDEPNDGMKAIMQRNNIGNMESFENQLITNDQPIEYPEIPIKQEILLQDVETSNDDNENSALNDTEALKNIIICDKFFHCKKTFEEHVNEKHTDSVSFNCSECSFTTNLKYSLERHIRSKHSSTSSFNCAYCSFKTYLKDCLVRHITWRHIKPTFNCDHCNYITRYRGNLRKHINTKHTKSITFNCSDCDYTTYTKSTLKKHLNAKHTPRNFNCTYCSYTTFRKTHLDSHINNKHTKSISFNCPYCEYNTCYTSTLKKHINSRHTRSVSFNCSDCNYTSYLKKNLLSHMKSKHS